MSPPKYHTMIPEGPMTVGCIDLMYGKTKKGTLCRLYYPTDLPPIKKIDSSKWTRIFLGEKYSEGVSNYRSYYLRSLYQMMMNRSQSELFVPAVWDGPISNKRKWPVIIFSHGLSAHRGNYSSICINWASYGFVVAAVEHRDGSTAATFTLSMTGEKEWHLMRTEPDASRNKNRNDQVKIRADECSRGLNLLTKLNIGDRVKNELTEFKFNLASLKDRLNISQPIVIGQSFGGATVLQTLYQDKKFAYGVALDPWLYPLKKDVKKYGAAIKQPILFVLMEAFQDPMNLDALSYFTDKKDNTTVTVKKSSHINQIDAIYILGSWMMSYIDGENQIDRELAMKINNNIILEFLEKYIKGIYIGKYNRKLLKDSSEHYIYEARGTAKDMLEWNLPNDLQ